MPGRLPYLTREAVGALFAFVGARPPTTQIAFTFSEGSGTPAAQALAERVAAVGEPFRSHLAEDELWPLLCVRGFTELDVPRPQQLAELYFRGRTDGLPAPTRSRIAIARV